MADICPSCGSEMITGTVAAKHSLCPKCGYSKTQIMGKVEAPSPLEALIGFAGVLGLSALAAAGISLLLKWIFEPSANGDAHGSREKPHRDIDRITRRKHYSYR
ncbi:MAG: hypothetical protein DRJ60_05885 [Thermoprotei archaeon]|nr:MAG: hypothetical protein DRJ60_05885 [Thermoprotei archaeon]